MDYKIALLPKAIDDFNASIDWYASINLLLAQQFISEIENSFKLILNNPFLFQTSVGDFKVVNTERFPFKIVYRIQANDIVIIAIFHHKRNPKKITARIK